MEEQKNLKKQFFLHIVYNMIAFSLIFIAFGIFVFFLVKNITFSSVDKQLNISKNEISEMDFDLGLLYEIFNIKDFAKNKSSDIEYNIVKKINNPQIIVILRDTNGKILNENDLGKIQIYKDDIEFSSENIDTTYNMKLGNEYDYRTLTTKLQSIEGSDLEYVQLLINIDTEMFLIKSYFKIIIYSVFFGIILSCIASFILSEKTLKPIQEVLKRQTEFVENASHELRTPLTIIQAKQELLLQEPNSKIIDKSEEIMLTLNETKRLSKLTKDLMVLVRGSNIKLQKDDVNIDEFIKNITLPYVELVEAQDKKFVLDLNFQKEISIDTNRIHQLLIILIDNALKYTEAKDTITIRTSLKDNKCIIEVLDTGIGITDEGLKRVFERFYREDKARNRESGGSGLGLSIASMIVRAHNGTIKASHNNPKGTIFTIRLNR